MQRAKDGRLTFAERRALVREVFERGVPVAEAAAAYSASSATARKWIGRYLAQGVPGLHDKPLEPRGMRSVITPASALMVARLHAQSVDSAEIAAIVEAPERVIGEVIARIRGTALMEPAAIGIGRLSEPNGAKPGQNIYMGQLRLRTVLAPSVAEDEGTFGRNDVLFACVDERSRVAFAAIHDDESAETARYFLLDAEAYFFDLNVTIRGVTTPRHPAYRAAAFNSACRTSGIKQLFNKVSDQTLAAGLREFFQASLLGWGARDYASSVERFRALANWLRDYNGARGQGVLHGRTPLAELRRWQHGGAA
ncbi:leucine zipper domain-containing protein [Niveibacterium sp. SC-1]|uniref:helix-turn-helix domain-containing protein n=2 Tax=Niveibacterium sp. SC-1 TaxID=3135646 RepID=UPI00311DDBC5